MITTIYGEECRDTKLICDQGEVFIITPPDKRCFRCQPLRLNGRLQSLCSGHGDDNRMVPASPECLGKLVLIPQFVNRKLPIPIKKGAQPALKPFCIP